MTNPTLVTESSPLVELRQYIHTPGGRDVLIEMFERSFLDEGIRSGYRPFGVFRDLDHPDRFVWLRGFGSLQERGRALEAFYTSPVWLEQRVAANATMIDTDDVLLMRPAAGAGALVLPENPPIGSEPPDTRVELTIVRLDRPAGPELIECLARQLAPALARTGAPLIGCYETDFAPNNYPRLPIRTEPALIWLTQFASDAAYRAHRRAWLAEPERSALHARLTRLGATRVERLRLQPTGRSPLGQPIAALDPVARNAAVADALLAQLPHRGPTPPAPPAVRHDRHEFDFLAGSWNVENRRLVQRGVGSDQWKRFPAACRVQLLLDSGANVDQIDFPTEHFSGLTVRLYEVETGRWKIYWVNSRQGVLFPPVEGGFFGARGEFFGADSDDGHPILARFLWLKLGPHRARWEQAFSYDEGPWETNWVMEFTRHDETR